MGNFTIQQHGAKGKILIIRLSGEVNWPLFIKKLRVEFIYGRAL